ncbi:hypothetical protein BESB_046970 [Besnoitia besnoiti]|uniref:Rab-GAP TBC domain-containing protein n=1 Tax=Besnoitia besnoiti TaxID=94643 RepID=A0A2A9MET9_BESBE|nr:hypothetical protein BESB_046970 [Besnoitia besnoiti]PFH36505.1 hypothetical protein BESB_046970 [Besnoitia besnoiti]
MATPWSAEEAQAPNVTPVCVPQPAWRPWKWGGDGAHARAKKTRDAAARRMSRPAASEGPRSSSWSRQEGERGDEPLPAGSQEREESPERQERGLRPSVPRRGTPASAGVVPLPVAAEAPPSTCFSSAASGDTASRVQPAEGVAASLSPPPRHGFSRSVSPGASSSSPLSAPASYSSPRGDGSLPASAARSPPACAGGDGEELSAPAQERRGRDAARKVLALRPRDAGLLTRAVSVASTSALASDAPGKLGTVPAVSPPPSSETREASRRATAAGGVEKAISTRFEEERIERTKSGATAEDPPGSRELAHSSSHSSSLSSEGGSPFAASSSFSLRISAPSAVRPAASEPSSVPSVSSSSLSASSLSRCRASGGALFHRDPPRSPGSSSSATCAYRTSLSDVERLPPLILQSLACEFLSLFEAARLARCSRSLLRSAQAQAWVRRHLKDGALHARPNFPPLSPLQPPPPLPSSLRRPSPSSASPASFASTSSSSAPSSSAHCSCRRCACCGEGPFCGGDREIRRRRRRVWLLAHGRLDRLGLQIARELQWASALGSTSGAAQRGKRREREGETACVERPREGREPQDKEGCLRESGRVGEGRARDASGPPEPADCLEERFRIRIDRRVAKRRDSLSETAEAREGESRRVCGDGCKAGVAAAAAQASAFLYPRVFMPAAAFNISAPLSTARRKALALRAGEANRTSSPASLSSSFSAFLEAFASGAERFSPAEGEAGDSDPRLPDDDEENEELLPWPCREVFEFLLTCRLDESRVDEIRRDVPRTFPHHPYFRRREGQAKLYAVLHAHASLCPSTGYCQGMNFLAGALLIFTGSALCAFWALVVMLRCLDFQLLFASGVPLLHARVFQFNTILTQHLPRLARHLLAHSLSVNFFAHQWLMTCFSYHVDLATVACIWDAFFLQGWKGLFRAAVTLLARLEPAILQRSSTDEILAVARVSEHRRRASGHCSACVRMRQAEGRRNLSSSSPASLSSAASLSGSPVGSSRSPSFSSVTSSSQAAHASAVRPTRGDRDRAFGDGLQTRQRGRERKTRAEFPGGRLLVYACCAECRYTSFLRDMRAVKVTNSLLDDLGKAFMNKKMLALLDGLGSAGLPGEALGAAAAEGRQAGKPPSPALASPSHSDEPSSSGAASAVSSFGLLSRLLGAVPSRKPATAEDGVQTAPAREAGALALRLSGEEKAPCLEDAKGHLGSLDARRRDAMLVSSPLVPRASAASRAPPPSRSSHASAASRRAVPLLGNGRARGAADAGRRLREAPGEGRQTPRAEARLASEERAMRQREQRARLLPRDCAERPREPREEGRGAWNESEKEKTARLLIRVVSAAVEAGQDGHLRRVRPAGGCRGSCEASADALEEASSHSSVAPRAAPNLGSPLSGYFLLHGEERRDALRVSQVSASVSPSSSSSSSPSSFASSMILPSAALRPSAECANESERKGQASGGVSVTSLPVSGASRDDAPGALAVQVFAEEECVRSNGEEGKEEESDGAGQLSLLGAGGRSEGRTQFVEAGTLPAPKEQTPFTASFVPRRRSTAGSPQPRPAPSSDSSPFPSAFLSEAVCDLSTVSPSHDAATLPAASARDMAAFSTSPSRSASSLASQPRRNSTPGAFPARGGHSPAKASPADFLSSGGGGEASCGVDPASSASAATPLADAGGSSAHVWAACLRDQMAEGRAKENEEHDVRPAASPRRLAASPRRLASSPAPVWGGRNSVGAAWCFGRDGALRDSFSSFSLSPSPASLCFMTAAERVSSSPVSLPLCSPDSPALLASGPVCLAAGSVAPSMRSETRRGRRGSALAGSPTSPPVLLQPTFAQPPGGAPFLTPSSRCQSFSSCVRYSQAQWSRPARPSLQPHSGGRASLRDEEREGAFVVSRSNPQRASPPVLSTAFAPAVSCTVFSRSPSSSPSFFSSPPSRIASFASSVSSPMSFSVPPSSSDLPSSPVAERPPAFLSPLAASSSSSGQSSASSFPPPSSLAPPARSPAFPAPSASYKTSPALCADAKRAAIYICVDMRGVVVRERPWEGSWLQTLPAARAVLPFALLDPLWRLHWKRKRPAEECGDELSPRLEGPPSRAQAKPAEPAGRTGQDAPGDAANESATQTSEFTPAGLTANSPQHAEAEASPSGSASSPRTPGSPPSEAQTPGATAGGHGSGVPSPRGWRSPSPIGREASDMSDRTKEALEIPDADEKAERPGKRSVTSTSPSTPAPASPEGAVSASGDLPRGFSNCERIPSRVSSLLPTSSPSLTSSCRRPPSSESPSSASSVSLALAADRALQPAAETLDWACVYALKELQQGGLGLSAAFVGGSLKGRYLLLALSEMEKSRRRLADLESQTRKDVKHFRAKIAAAERDISMHRRTQLVQEKKYRRLLYEQEKAYIAKLAAVRDLELLISAAEEDGNGSVRRRAADAASEGACKGEHTLAATSTEPRPTKDCVAQDAVAPRPSPRADGIRDAQGDEGRVVQKKIAARRTLQPASGARECLPAQGLAGETASACIQGEAAKAGVPETRERDGGFRSALSRVAGGEGVTLGSAGPWTPRRGWNRPGANGDVDLVTARLSCSPSGASETARRRDESSSAGPLSLFSSPAKTVRSVLSAAAGWGSKVLSVGGLAPPSPREGAPRASTEAAKRAVRGRGLAAFRPASVSEGDARDEPSSAGERRCEQGDVERERGRERAETDSREEGRRADENGGGEGEKPMHADATVATSDERVCLDIQGTSQQGANLGGLAKHGFGVKLYGDEGEAHGGRAASRDLRESTGLLSSQSERSGFPSPLTWTKRDECRGKGERNSAAAREGDEGWRGDDAAPGQEPAGSGNEGEKKTYASVFSALGGMRASSESATASRKEAIAAALKRVAAAERKLAKRKAAAAGARASLEAFQAELRDLEDIKDRTCSFALAVY